MESAGFPGVAELTRRLDEAVGLGDARKVTSRVKHDLAELIAGGAIELPRAMCAPRPDAYARRLLHRDTARGYTVVVMTWGPGQGTQLHDHAGIWCVEGVVSGEMDVVQFELTEETSDGRFRFSPRGRVHAMPGSAGALIPPFEYHILRNALEDRSSVTVHVYGGEMSRSNVFEADSDGAYRKLERALAYND